MSETDMTDQYAELRAALAAGPTPGPWTGHRMGIEKDRIGEYVQASVNVSPGDDFFFICAKRPDGSDADLCLTGNGPTSAINTQYIIAANPEVIRALLRERDELAAMSDAARDVIAERARQMSVEGWTPEHDDEHADESLAIAAVCYVLFGDSPNSPNHPPSAWPWAAEWWKPKDHRRNLVRATALLIAELERRDRADAAMAGREGEG